MPFTAHPYPWTFSCAFPQGGGDAAHVVRGADFLVSARCIGCVGVPWRPIVCVPLPCDIRGHSQKIFPFLRVRQRFISDFYADLFVESAEIDGVPVGLVEASLAEAGGLLPQILHDRGFLFPAEGEADARGHVKAPGVQDTGRDLRAGHGGFGQAHVDQLDVRRREAGAERRQPIGEHDVAAGRGTAHAEEGKGGRLHRLEIAALGFRQIGVGDGRFKMLAAVLALPSLVVKHSVRHKVRVSVIRDEGVVLPQAEIFRRRNEHAFRDDFEELAVEVHPCFAKHSIGPDLVEVDHRRSLVTVAPSPVLSTST